MTQPRNNRLVPVVRGAPRRKAIALLLGVVPVLVAVSVLSGLDALPVQGAADVVSVRGDARVVRGAERSSRLLPSAAVRPGATVRPGDRVVTGPDGRVELAFRDGARVTVAPGSDFRIDAWRCDADVQRCFVSLARGAVRTVGGAIGKRDPADYRFVAPTSTVGIRG
jgi:hypothetical protein